MIDDTVRGIESVTVLCIYIHVKNLSIQLSICI